MYDCVRGPALPPTHPTGTITFVFTDIEGSTRLWQTQGESMAAALARHDELLRAALETAGGYVFKALGDGFCAAFSSADDAVQASLAGQLALTSEAWPTDPPLRCRFALHTGEAELRDGDYFGPDLSRTARLLAIVNGGQVLLSEAATAALDGDLPDGAALRELGRHRLRDFATPERLAQLTHPDLPDDRRRPTSLDDVPHNLPQQATSLVGRRQELAAVEGLLRTQRLVTLLGPGGTGKTRLALQIACEQLAFDRQGVWLVELADVAEEVAPAVATVLGVREAAAQPLLELLAEHLAEKRVLLVLDNCEHLVEPSAVLAAALLRRCPQVQLLVTSREALNVPGEAVFAVPPLTLPPAEARAAEALAAEAGQLFAERARAVQPAFELTDANAPAIAEICRRLDGLPLAIELAAARCGTMSPEQVAARLDQRFRLLTGGSRTLLPRQRTLQALIDWSYELLDSAERTLLQRLSVFSGGWSLAAVERVCGDGGGDDWELLDRLTGLAAKSLVAFDPAAGRYRLLESVREYATMRLVEAGEAETARDRHLAWAVGLAEDRPDDVEVEHDNLLAALNWCEASADGAAQALCLTSALGWFWSAKGHLVEGRQQMERALSRSGADSTERARTQNELGIVCRLLGDFEAAERWHQASLEQHERLGDRRGQVVCLGNLGILATDQRHLERARELLTLSRGLVRDLGDAVVECALLNNLSSVAHDQGDLDGAVALLEESLALARAVGDGPTCAASLANLGLLWLERGDRQRSGECYREALRLSLELEHRVGYPEAFEGLATLLAETEPRRAAQLAGVAMALRAELDMPLPDRWRADLDAGLTVARRELGPVAYEAALCEGAAWPFEQACEIALAPV